MQHIMQKEKYANSKNSLFYLFQYQHFFFLYFLLKINKNIDENSKIHVLFILKHLCNTPLKLNNIKKNNNYIYHILYF